MTPDITVKNKNLSIALFNKVSDKTGNDYKQFVLQQYPSVNLSAP